MRSASPAGGTPRTSTSICFWWYHFGDCTRDPARFELDRPCIYQHRDYGDGVEQKLSKGRLKRHSTPCGLPLCKWRGQVPRPARGATNGVLHSVVSEQGNQSGCDHPKSTKNQSRPCHHPDEPQRAAKRVKVSYEDLTTADDQYSDEQGTCFFWYHGNCSRKGMCTYPHGLTDPPSMVQPPPGFTHPGPCGLEWCPGGSRVGAAKKTGRKRYYQDLKELKEIEKRPRRAYEEVGMPVRAEVSETCGQYHDIDT